MTHPPAPSIQHRTAFAPIRFGCIVLLLTCTALASLDAAAGDPEPLPAALDTSIVKGLAFLVRQQAPDGSFGADGPKVPITGLSLLAFLASGNTPDLGKYGLAVHNAVDYLLAQQAADGYFGAGERGMYAHAIVTLALAEDFGVESSNERRIRIRTALVKAVEIIVSAQNVAKSNPNFVGGWRYERNSTDSDLSLSGWNVMALRAAGDIGIDVPREAMQHAAEFVLRCYDQTSKGFCYQPGSGAQPGDTAIGMLCLYALQAVDANVAKLDGAAEFLASHAIDDTAPFFYYAVYYATQAQFQRGAEAWAKTGTALLERLVKLQQPEDGGWPAAKSGQEPGRVYATAMAVQTLAVPYRLLPAYQR